MRKFRRLAALVMATTLVASQAMPVLADNTTTGTDGTGNILDYATTTVVVPTTIKIAINPNGYTVNTKYTEVASDAAFDSGTTYYTKESDGKFKKADIDAFAANTTYYTASQLTDQIVSLNYGLANKSTEAMDVSIDIKADYTAVSNNEAIEFVDSSDKTAAYDETSNPDGAKKGEYKMFVAVASAKAPADTSVPVTADTYAKASAYAANTTYYTKTVANNVTTFAEAASQPADAAAFKANGPFYVKTTTIGPEILSSQLSDVGFAGGKDATEANYAVFAADDSVKAKASVAYLLGKATYSVKDDEIIDFDTTQAQLAEKIELSAIGGVAGFTFTGSLNADADWTQADASAIKFTPIYTWTESEGEEEAITGAYNQIKTEPANAAPSIATTSGTYSKANGITISNVKLGNGDLAATQISKVQVTTSSGEFVDLAASNWTYSDGTLTVSGTWGGCSVGDTRSLKVIFNDSANTAKVIECTIAD